MNVQLCIYHPDPILLKAYHQLFENSSGFESVGQFTDFDSLCRCIETRNVSVALVSPKHLDEVNLSICRRKIRERNPKIRILVLGDMDLNNHIDDLLVLPVRGVVDYIKQNKFEILQCLRQIMRHGFDFSYLKLNYPDHEQRIIAYEQNIPNVDERFWELLPLLASEAKRERVAAHFRVSRKTLNQWILRYCDIFQLNGINELIVMAANNGWIDNDQVRIALEQLNSEK